MMSTVNAGPPPSEVRRTVAIDFLFLDLSACGRCSGTDVNIETALAAIDGVLRARGRGSSCAGSRCGRSSRRASCGS
jgi:hypothetical protein